MERDGDVPRADDELEWGRGRGPGTGTPGAIGALGEGVRRLLERLLPTGGWRVRRPRRRTLAAIAALALLGGVVAWLGGRDTPTPAMADDETGVLYADRTSEGRRSGGEVVTVRDGLATGLPSVGYDLVDPVAMDVTDDGTRLALVDGRSRLQVVDLATGDQWSTLCNRCTGVAWWGGNTQVAVDTGGGITVLGVFEGPPPEVLRVPAGASAGGLDPTGLRLVRPTGPTGGPEAGPEGGPEVDPAEEDLPPARGLVLSDRDGGNPTFLPGSELGLEERVLQLAWSPDGETVAYVVAMPVGGADGTGWVFDLRTVATDGSGATQVAAMGGCACPDGGDVAVAWSPDGERLAVSRPIGGADPRTTVLERDGTEVDGLGGGAGGPLAWGPDAPT